MHIHVLGGADDARNRALLDANFRLRHEVFVERQGWEALRRPDRRDIDEFDNADATHILVTDEHGLAGGSRITPLDKPNLLQTVFNGLVQGNLPAAPWLGADWTRFYVRPDRRQGWRRTPESAALFCAVMEHALMEGYAYLTFVSSIAMLEHGTSVGWRITPLGNTVMIDGKPTLAAWIEVSEKALYNVRRATGMSRTLIPERSRPHQGAPELRTGP